MNSDDDLAEPLTRIVCAAIRHTETELVIPCVRHYDPQCRVLLEELQCYCPAHFPTVAGFLTNTGEFLTRQQAWIVAEKAGQIRPHPSQVPDELHSEDLY